MMMKKNMRVAGIILLVTFLALTALLFLVRGSGKDKTASPTPRPKLSLPVNQIPVSERPYITLAPTAGREVVLTIEDLKKRSESVDYELQYSAGDKEEAAIGSIDFLGGKDLHTKTILLGSKSGGGKITYHESVTGGSLVLTFYDENYKLSNEWSYVDNKKPQTVFYSRDGKFQINAGKLFNGSPYVVVYQNAGLPSPVEGELLGGPYSVAGTSQFPSGKAEVTVRLSDDKPAEIIGWDGNMWKSFTTKVSEKEATAAVDLLQTYVAVEKQ